MNSHEMDTRPREQLGALYEIGRTVNSTLELPEVLDGILGMTLQLFTADAGSIMLLRDGKLRIEAARGLPDDVVRDTEIALGEGIAGWVARTGEMLLLNGKVDDSRFHGIVNRRDEITSSLCTPLRSRSGIIGVMMVRRGGPTTFSRGQLEFFSSVADQAAIAIENARLFRSERKRAQQLDIARQKFQAIFSAMADGVLVSDADGVVVHANEAAHRLLDGGGDLLDQRIFDLLPGLPMEHIRSQVAAGGGPYEMESHRKGHQTLRVTVTPLAQAEDEAQELVFLVHDVTERVRVERMKSEFLSAVSHELKTPLTTVTGFLELLLHREFERPRQEQYLRISLEEAGRLQRLIEDLLTLSRLESGRFQFQMKERRLEEILAKVLTGFSERHPNYQFQLLAEKVPPISLDEDLVTQVVVNLLSNSVKYSPHGGRVEVRVRQEGGVARVSVQDEGIGIPRDKIPFIFEKFYRVDNSLTRATGGTGLGLTNARYIVEGHGGSIWAESEGQGATFTFELPLEPAATETKSEA